MPDPSGSTLSSLLENRQFIDRLGESIPGLVYVYDLVAKRNVYTNRAMAEQLGYSPEQVRAMGEALLGAIIHPDDLPRAIEHHRRMSDVTDSKLSEIEYRVRSASGEDCWLHSWEAVLSRDPAGRPHLLLGIVQDVTRRVHMEEALRDSERRLGESEQRWR
jgi:PAS domain S-box-containing protein